MLTLAFYGPSSMTIASDVQTLFNCLHAPQQDLAQLSFCKGKESHVKAWVSALPLTQINFASAQFYNALPEIARLQCSAETRLAMLESLRSPVQQCIQGLSQSFLNQPLILPEAARKAATIAQALQKHMSNGYLVAVRDLCGDKRQTNEEGQALQALAISRAITGLGLLLLRSYQLYTPISAQLWAELHGLYLLAETLQLSHLVVDDPLSKHQKVRNIEQAYMRVLLLACSRANQLRQDEVLATYYALESLNTLGQLLPHDSSRKDNLFAVSLSSNLPPLYKSRLPSGVNQNIRDLNTSQLAKKLEEHAAENANNNDSGASRNAYGLSIALTDHLIQAWNILAQRSFERQLASGSVDITVGLSNIHYHVADETPFPIFLGQANNLNSGNDAGKIFQKLGVQLKPSTSAKEDDPWEESFDAGGSTLAGRQLPTTNIDQTLRQQQRQAYQDKHPVFKVPQIDTSPGGYCLEWQDEIPAQVKAGELIGLREEGRHKWSIGVVRWVQQAATATQLGIQILAPHATPAGIAIVHKTGGFSEYLRALQLPALKAVNQPATLITNAISFREYHKVRLFSPTNPLALEAQQTEHSLQLSRKAFSTGAFSQFTFREIVINKPAESDSNVDDFDEVWKS